MDEYFVSSVLISLITSIRSKTSGFPGSTSPLSGVNELWQSTMTESLTLQLLILCVIMVRPTPNSMSSLPLGAKVDNITIPLLKNCTPIFAAFIEYLLNLVAYFEYSTFFNPSLTLASILSISETDIGLKSCVEGPCATIVKWSNLLASIVGIFDPPIFPNGPGCTDGDMNSDLMPFFPLKLMNVTTVSIASPIFSKVDSKRSEPSFICIMNRLSKSSIPMPRFFFNGEAAIVMNE